MLGNRRSDVRLRPGVVEGDADRVVVDVVVVVAAAAVVVVVVVSCASSSRS